MVPVWEAIVEPGEVLLADLHIRLEVVEHVIAAVE
jgi:hypothetical protein